MALVDSREPKKFIRGLRKAGIEVDVLELDMSDYVIGPFTIERKDSEDFMASIKDGRLWNQQWAMLHDEEDHIPVLLVHGDVPPKTKWVRYGKRVYSQALTKSEYQQRVKSMIGAICTSLYSYKDINIVMVEDEDQAIMFLTQLYYRVKGKEKSRIPIKKLPAKSMKDYKRNMLCQLPRIGSGMAEALLSTGMSIKELAEAPIEDICKIPGISTKTATKIHNILNL